MNMYIIMFGVGAGIVLLTFLLGEFLEFECGSGLSFFRPTLIAVFLTVTGGLGWLLSPRLEGILGNGIVLTISVLGGLTIAGIIHRFVIIPMQKAQNTSAFHKQAAIGITAKVISPIPQGKYGKIQYNISGSVVTGPAKSEDGGEIKNGENVNIVYIENNTYFVKRED
jgi:membrane protein implicated in regulation of membrane protease activity